MNAFIILKSVLGGRGLELWLHMELRGGQRGEPVGGAKQVSRILHVLVFVLTDMVLV